MGTQYARVQYNNPRACYYLWYIYIKKNRKNRD